MKIEPEAERAYYWSTLALHDQAEEILVVAADDHGCRLRSSGGLYERLGAGAVHIHPLLTHGGSSILREEAGPSRWPWSLMFTLYVFLIADVFSAARPVGLHL